MSQFILYNYFRSSASYRVRLALEYKQLKYEYRAVHLVNNGGEQHAPEFLRLNPMGEVPCLIHRDAARKAAGDSAGEAADEKMGGREFALGQSMAILFYLDSWTLSLPSSSAASSSADLRLFPQDARAMAQVLQICEMVNSGIHPIQNLKVLKFLTEKFQATTEERNEWSQHWIEIGFRALEEQVKRTAGECCFGDQLSAADCFLIPQMYNARRFAVDVKKFPTLLRIDTHIQSLPFAVAAHPDQQPDAPKS